MTRDAFILALHRIHAIRFGDFTLKNGQKSTIYLDIRQIISWPELLRAAASLLWQTLTSHAKTADRLCGVPYTALPIATCLSLQHNIPMVLRRKEKKTHGRGQLIDGAFEKNQRCLIIEDVMTTGSSILETATDLVTVELTVTDVGLLVDRETGGKQALEKAGIETHTVFTLNEILQTLSHVTTISSHEKEIINTLLNNNTTLA